MTLDWGDGRKRGAFSSVSQSHSPGFGPVFTTSDPDSFWQQLNEMHALGGGDEPEMCLSALEVCSPPLPRPFPPPPRSPGLTIKGARASLGPTLHPIFRTWSHSFHSRFQGHTAFYSAFPCSAHSPTATILKTFIYFSLKAAIFYHQFFLSLPAGSAAHTGPAPADPFRAA